MENSKTDLILEKFAHDHAGASRFALECMIKAWEETQKDEPKQDKIDSLMRRATNKVRELRSCADYVYTNLHSKHVEKSPAAGDQQKH